MATAPVSASTAASGPWHRLARRGFTALAPWLLPIAILALWEISAQAGWLSRVGRESCEILEKIT